MTDNNENNEPTVPGWEPSPSVARAMTGGTK